MRKVITILCHDLASNALSRSWTLAKLLETEYRTHIVGLLNGEVWEPLRNDSTIEYRPIHFRHRWDFVTSATQTIRKQVEGNLIIAVKPIQTSFGLGLMAKRLLGRPLLLDIDDWEMGFLLTSIFREAISHSMRWFSAVNSPLNTRWLHRKIGCADAVTVSNTFLQQQYGGLWIGHACDELIFDMTRFSNKQMTARTVLFLGTAREHKGLDNLIAAWKLVKSPDARLRIVGTPLDDSIIQRLAAGSDARVSFAGRIPFHRVPETIAAADIFVIPQQNSRASIGQLPMKLMGAMALGRAIIATSVGDLPLWLNGGAGLIVPPNDPTSLCVAIERLLSSNSEERKTLGLHARERFLEYGSFKSVRNRFLPLVAELIHARKPAHTHPAFSDEYRSQFGQSL